MSKIVWDVEGQHYYENGVDHGVLYVSGEDGYEEGVAWNGLTAVNESPDGADVTDFWADNIKYASLRAAENFKGSIEAYTYPKEFEACDGSAEIAAGVVIGQQARRPFAFCYRTKIGNDTKGAANPDYKIHIVYGATVSPSEKAYETVNDNPEAITFSWDFETTPVKVGDDKFTSCVTIDSRNVAAEKMQLILNKLYGTDSTEPTLAMPDDIVDLLK